MARNARPIRHLLNRDGRYIARLAVPSDLRTIVRKRELLEPLGADRKNAIARLHGAIDRIQRILAEARQGVPPKPPAISVPHAVQSHYRAELAHDDGRACGLGRRCGQAGLAGAGDLLPGAARLRSVRAGRRLNGGRRYRDDQG